MYPDNKHETEKVTRHLNTKDTWSILESDNPQPSAEEVATSERMYQEMIRSLPTDRERIIAMAMGNGFDQVDVAFMTKSHPTQISRSVKRIRETFASYNTFRVKSNVVELKLPKDYKEDQILFTIYKLITSKR